MGLVSFQVGLPLESARRTCFLTHIVLFIFLSWPDIDDTIKVSNVLDTVELVKSTLLEEAKAVTGMPGLYSSLSKSLSSPPFIYITGSPYQVYPFLNQFIDTSYPDAKGPIFAQNLTVLNIVDAKIEVATFSRLTSSPTN